MSDNGLPKLGVMVNGHKFMPTLTRVSLARKGNKANGPIVAALTFGAVIPNAANTQKLLFVGHISGQGVLADMARGQRGVKRAEYVTGVKNFGQLEPFAQWPNDKRYYWPSLSEGEVNGLAQVKTFAKTFYGAVTGQPYDMAADVTLTVARVEPRLTVAKADNSARATDIVSASADDAARASKLAAVMAELENSASGPNDGPNAGQLLADLSASGVTVELADNAASDDSELAELEAASASA